MLAGCSAVLIGCGGTFENRSINFSSDGKHVAFQRGDGIYIANKDGKGLTKITPPDKDAIAVGMPEWAPNDQRLIFATARPVGDSHSAVTWPGLRRSRQWSILPASTGSLHLLAARRAQGRHSAANP